MREAGMVEQPGGVERVTATDPGDEPDGCGVEPEARTRGRVETAAAHLTHRRAGCGWDDIVNRHLADDDQIGGVARCQGLSSRPSPFRVRCPSQSTRYRRRGAAVCDPHPPALPCAVPAAAPEGDRPKATATPPC